MDLEKKSNKLIYTSFGDENEIHNWLNGDKSFDIWGTYYGDNEVSNKTIDSLDFFDKKKLGKLPNFFRLYDKYKEIISSYDLIWLVDDDIKIDNKDIQNLFQYQNKYDTSILQPSNSNKGKVNHSITESRSEGNFRYTNFVEVTAPLFKTQFLLDWYESQFIPLKQKFQNIEHDYLRTHNLKINHENFRDFGLDFWWSHYAKTERKKMGIVDKIEMINPLYEGTIQHLKVNELLGYTEDVAQQMFIEFNNEFCVKCECEAFNHKCTFNYYDFE